MTKGVAVLNQKPKTLTMLLNLYKGNQSSKPIWVSEIYILAKNSTCGSYVPVIPDPTSPTTEDLLPAKLPSP
jgi:hypothetical protein